jgi:hypothetical protein
MAFNKRAGRFMWKKSPRKPTIYEALREKLGREPTHAEVKADVFRILGREDSK